MTEKQLNVILATALDLAGDDKAAASRILMRYGLAQAASAEEDISDHERQLLTAALSLFELPQDVFSLPWTDKWSPDSAYVKDEEGKPKTLLAYIRRLLEEVTLQTFEIEAICALVGLRGTEPDEANLMRYLAGDIDRLVAADDNDESHYHTGFGKLRCKQWQK
jgi:hypothetical protein